jgi:hypothetical protein
MSPTNFLSPADAVVAERISREKNTRNNFTFIGSSDLVDGDFNSGPSVAGFAIEGPIDVSRREAFFVKCVDLTP